MDNNVDLEKTKELDIDFSDSLLEETSFDEGDLGVEIRVPQETEVLDDTEELEVDE